MDRFVSERVKSMLITGSFHLLLILFLLFTYIKMPDTKRFSQALEGVPVMFGNVKDAFGTDNPGGRGDGTTDEQNINIPVPGLPAEAVESSSKASTSKAVTPNQTLTQNNEQTTTVKTDAQKKADAQKRQADIDAENRKKAADEEARKAKAESDAKSNINKTVGGSFGGGQGGGSRGGGSGPGAQGSPTGNADHGKTSGVGGWGTFDLGGRGVGSGGLVQPAYTVNDYGVVVVDIIVDPKGNVVSASVGKGTNTPNSTLRNSAIRAAQRTKFNAVGTVGNQKGTITYRFNYRSNQ